MDEHVESRRLTRGVLIKAGTAAALAVGAGGAGRAVAGVAGADLAPSAIGTPTGGAAHLRRETYVPLLGTTFLLHRPEARPLRVRLIEARRRKGVGDSFSLLFRSRTRPGIDGGIYRLEHRSLGTFELFVSPVGRGVKGLDLEAVVNRIKT